MTFWCGAPMFDINELNGAGRKGFEECISLSRHFYPILKEKGYYAWDINEKIGLLRKACGLWDCVGGTVLGTDGSMGQAGPGVLSFLAGIRNQLSVRSRIFYESSWNCG